MRDPYDVLGLGRTASAAEIKTAYRKLARTLHPDVNPDDPSAEGRFREVSAAYELLSDEQKRRRYDRGEIDAEGNERRRAYSSYRRGGSGFAGSRPGAASGSSGPGAGAGSASSGRKSAWWFEDLLNDEDEFSFARGNGPGGRQHTAPRRGADASYRLPVTFEEAITGCTRQLSLNTGKTVSVKVPAGSEAGKILRLKGMGGAGMHGGSDGDAMVEIQVLPHAVFQREGDDVIADIPVSLKEAVLGDKVTVPTVDGRVSVTVPAGSNTGTVLRLRGKGAPRASSPGERGDQMCRLKIVLEDPDDPELKALVRKMSAGPFSLRSKLGF